MASLKRHPTLGEYQTFIYRVYGPANQKHFTADEMLTNINRFTTRGLKGIRKEDRKKTETNLMIAASWMLSLMNQFGIDLDERVWKRFPYHCSYCGKRPCACKINKVKKRIRIQPNSRLRPKTLGEIQAMFGAIYPPSSRTLEHAGIHLAEEMGELSEAVLRFRGSHAEPDFERVKTEAADAFSCFMGVFNSLDFDYEEHVGEFFRNGCHACKSIPCVCDHDVVINFRS
jgi:NTP pyrophosphatase (non-canonical NTP hydrolase)